MLHQPRPEVIGDADVGTVALPLWAGIEGIQRWSYWDLSKQ
jgi:hypothetical protein